MRFQRLQVPAFGPFTNLELAFPSRDPDLHVIYGENEAGKSSLLRAMRDLLFGIHGQSPDNFLHDYKDLRLLGEIQNRAGESLSFQRRKGNKNTLLDPQGNPLPDNALRPFLGSMDQAYFSAMFGLGGHELREGGEQLLEGEGEIGKALFSASLGGTPIQRILDVLEDESNRIFKGRATTKVSIRPAVNRHKELLKQSRDATVNAETWERMEKDLAQQETVKKGLEEEIDGFEREIAWISRCEDALPSVGRLNEATTLRHALPDLPDVASDFVERARSARNAAGVSSGKVQILNAQITQLESQLADCVTSPQVLAEADALDVLHQDLGAYREQKKALTKLQTKLAGIEPVLRAGMKSLEVPGELASLETLRLGSAVWLSCEEAAKVLQGVLNRQNDNRGNADKLKTEIESVEKELKRHPERDLTPLRETLAMAAEATEANKTLAASQTLAENLILKVAVERALVPGVPEDLDAAIRLSVSTPATLRKFRERFDRLERDIQDAMKSIRNENNRVKTLEDELRRLERRGELPSEDSLKQARDYRDHGWQLVLADWKGDGAKEALAADTPLEEAFPRAIIRADRIADQLRLDAEVVAQAEEKRLQIRNGQEKIRETTVTLASLQDLLKECQTSWEAEWARTGIRPRSPGEMEEWRENWVRLRETSVKLRETEAAVNAKNAQVQRAREALAGVLMDSRDKSFVVLFEAAIGQVRKGEESAGRRSAIRERLENLKKQLESLDRQSESLLQAIETAEANWRSWCRTAGFPEGMTPDSGQKLLQERKQLLTNFDIWKELSGEAGMMAETVLWYEQRVDEKAASLGIVADLTEAREAGLWKALSLARTIQAAHDQLVFQIQGGKHGLTTAQQMERQTLQSLEELLRLARLGRVEDLEPLLANLEKRTEVQSRIKSFRETLSGLARNQPMDAFIARVQTENADELPQRKALMENHKTAKKRALQGVQAECDRLNRQKQELEKAVGTAADFRQQAESVATTLKQDASRFIRLRLASHFLQTQIEQFREENQGPLLEKSGQVFKQITQGAFDGLATEVNDQDIPMLAGRRTSGKNVPVKMMSDGSRDQLYLALRLAAMDRYLEEHEPMPLILDDLLITFDNERARAILPQLAHLAGRAQIFLFTHHEHLIELCHETLGEDQFMLHPLVTSL
ncbi:MAG: AAA family ATPase [Pseudomonadota bacterium]